MPADKSNPFLSEFGVSISPSLDELDTSEEGDSSPPPEVSNNTWHGTFRRLLGSNTPDDSKPELLFSHRYRRLKSPPLSPSEEDPFADPTSEEDPFANPTSEEDPFADPASEEDPFADPKMYSNSSSYLGGANSNRPGQPPFGQASFSNAPQGQQQQSYGLVPQQTGFANAPLQQQYTGLPSQGIPQAQPFQAPPQQPQPTGYPPQNFQSFQGQPPQQLSQPTGYPLQNQQTFQNQLPLQQPLQTGQPQAQIIPQRTGFTSSQIAQSFQSSPAPPTVTKPVTTCTRIPKIRLSFIMAEDQAKFEQLFKAAVGKGQALDGDKVRDILLRSGLPGRELSQIWVLSDTTKSGQLLFPEFALAMYLCHLKLTGKDLPPTLPERIANEVSSMVDIISFGIPDDRPQAPTRSNAPNFDVPSRTTVSPSIQQPQPQASNSQLLTQLTSQQTGFASQYIPPQPTGFQPQNTGFAPQQASFLPQQTGFQQAPQGIGYAGLRPPMPPMPTGFNSNFQQQTSGPASSLNAQPTGRPGQWGLVNTPASGLPNIDALQQRMMPQPGREGGFTTAGLSGSAVVPWAVTKDEKRIYDGLFKAWDGLNKGFIGGDVAIEVMGQSGLDKSDLEKIWTLSDRGNKGRLDMDEFAVAMHLIYRKLNGYIVPPNLPPELEPPSARNLADSIGTVKSLLSRDAEIRKNTGAFLQPQKTGVSYLKNHSFRSDSNGITPNRKDATVFRNNDDDAGYKSSARRRLNGGGRTPSPVRSSSANRPSNEDLSVEQLRKKIREKQVILDAIDFKEENNVDEDEALDRRDWKDVEDLKQRIRRIQEGIDSHPNAALRNVDTGAERRALQRQLQALVDRVPELTSRIRKTERDIADKKLELFRLKDARAHPGTASTVVGTGPGGTVTEADRLKARAKALMEQRSAALTGKRSTTSIDDASAASVRLDEEQSKIRAEKENNERKIKEVEDSIHEFTRRLKDSLKDGQEDSSREHERRRWEEGLGVEDEVKEFIFELQRSSRSARIRHEEKSRSRADPQDTSSRLDSGRDRTPTGRDNSMTGSSSSARPPVTSTSTGSSYSSYKTGEERAAFIKQQAEQRMAERLAALGLKAPTKLGESTQQRHDREAKEREERRRQAEAEDVRRDQERQQRLEDEQPSAPTSMKTPSKKPQPPPPRKTRADSVDQKAEAKRKADEEALLQKAEQEGKERAIKEQQKIQEDETKHIEDEAERQENELAREREAAQMRLKALEEQVKAGKIKKQEEKRRKQAAEKEAKEKETKLAAQRAELEAAKERERQLQLQLESLDDDSSDEEGPQETTPQETTPTSSVVLNSVTAPSTESRTLPPKSTMEPEAVTAAINPPSAPASAPPPSSTYSSETKNPFFKKLSQSNESNATPSSQPQSSIGTPSTNEVSTNPFHRLTQQDNSSKSLPSLLSTPTGTRPSRVRPEEDEWSVVDSTEDSSDDDDDENGRPMGGSAKQLASMLFGTMAPPRPLSAMDDKKSPTMPTASADRPFSPSAASPPTPSFSTTGAPSAPPPPPPPMPAVFASGASPSAPPPPPPMPGAFPGAGTGPPPAAAPPAMGALLGDIVKGKGLRKVETKDKSQASVAGRVLG